MAHTHRKFKKHYTISVTSDYSSFKTKYYRCRFNILKVLIVSMFIVVALAAVLTVYCFDYLGSLESRLDTFEKLIDERNSTIEVLSASNEELKRENDILTGTVAVQTRVSTEDEKESQLRHLPTLFPLTGSASLVQQDKDADYYVEIAVFEMSSLSDVVASGEGTVISVREDAEYGSYIAIDHGNGFVSIYRNAGEAKVMEGDEVTKGMILFVGGDEGMTLGYQITYEGKYLDPMKIIEING